MQKKDPDFSSVRESGSTSQPSLSSPVNCSGIGGVVCLGSDGRGLPHQLAADFSHAAAICDDDQIHHARIVRDFVAAQPGLNL
ncbi:hypothetical protein [Streptomyces sp. NPDC046909]|uniref:hypothetical protein n=1 Tax=Streptomyces sp. NPDC046909 TaxID=3155617 RepID=UPI0033CE8E72